MSVEQNVAKFVRGKTRRAVCIHGPWGVGKTHMWNQVVKAQGVQQTYVSLFGVDSLESLKAQVALAAQDQAALKWHERKYYVRDLWRWLTGGGSLVPSEYGGGGQFTSAAQALAFYFVRRRLICIDDVERRGSNLRLKDVFGLVSHLDERRGCRVCVILNSGALDASDGAEWAEQREKVFEAEFYYDPSAEAAVKVALGDGDQLQRWHKDAVDAICELDIKNVRVIRRIARSLDLVFGEVGQVHEATVRRVARDVVFLEYCNCGSALGAPPLEFLMRTSPMALALDRINQERHASGGSRYTAEEMAFAEKISRYDIDSSDRLTKLLSEGVAVGYPASNLRELVEAWDREARTHAKHERFHAAWRRYRNDLSAGEEEVLGEMMASWAAVVDNESAMNADGFARMLRSHGRDDLASRVINDWIAARSGSRVDEIQEEAVSFFGEIRDAEFLQALSQARQAAPVRITLDAALDKIASSAGDEEAFSAIARADVSELASAFRRRELSFYVIKELLDRRSAHIDAYSRAGINTEAALRSIASVSEWDAVRIRTTHGVSGSAEI
jgi:hypothetical protein